MPTMMDQNNVSRGNCVHHTSRVRKKCYSLAWRDVFRLWFLGTSTFSLKIEVTPSLKLEYLSREIHIAMNIDTTPQKASTTKALSSSNKVFDPCPSSCAVKLSRRHDAVPSRGALIILQTMARKILSAMRADFGQQYSATRYQALLDYLGKTPLYMTLVYVVGVVQCRACSCLLFLMSPYRMGWWVKPTTF